MNILIVKLSAIGDVIHTLPALNAVREYYPDANITWLVEEDASDIIEGHRSLDRVLISKRKRWIKGLLGSSWKNNIKEVFGFIRELRDTEYDLIITFQLLIKSGILIGLSRGKCKVGYGRGMEHMEHSYLFLNKRISPVGMDNHALLRGLMLLEAIGIKHREIKFNIFVQDQDRNKINDLLKKHGIKKFKRLIAINPMAKWTTKLWSNAKFAELADSLIKQSGTKVVFTGSKGDRKTIQNIISCMKEDAINLAGETSLKMLASLYEKINFLVSTDTGPMHMAAAVGTPVVALFGPTAPWRTGPFGAGHHVIRANIKCSPCFKRQCKTNDCMNQISVKDVLDEIQKMEV